MAYRWKTGSIGARILKGVMMPTKSKNEHRQAPIIDNDEVVFSVDEKLQTLIQFLYDNDFITFNSCEDNVEGTCWIEYLLEDWIAINEIAFRTESQDLYQFIEGECKVLLLSSEDGYLDENDEYWIDSEDLIWSASVRFPKELLPIFEELLRATLVDLHSEDSEQ